jgi:hypothetical protein
MTRCRMNFLIFHLQHSSLKKLKTSYMHGILGLHTKQQASSTTCHPTIMSNKICLMSVLLQKQIPSFFWGGGAEARKASKTITVGICYKQGELNSVHGWWLLWWACSHLWGGVTKQELLVMGHKTMGNSALLWPSDTTYSDWNCLVMAFFTLILHITTFFQMKIENRVHSSGLLCNLPQIYQLWRGILHCLGTRNYKYQYQAAI